MLRRARAFSAPLLEAVLLDSGEPALLHGDAVQAILAAIGADEPTRAAAWLTLAAGQLAKPEEQLTKAFGRDNARLALEGRKLMEVFRVARERVASGGDVPTEHREMLRRLLLAMSEDLRVIPLRLASRLQSLRFFTSAGVRPADDFVQSSLQIWAPLANRLGLWQVKWEIEDLAFRLDRPDEYARISEWMRRRGSEHEALIAQASSQVREALAAQGIDATINGRRKHAYSIWRKMQGKSLELDQVMDLLALRIVVGTVDQCYAALGVVHALWNALDAEYDDYIARPKANGYQSLHTVVRGPRQLPLEIQIRTQAMHEHAEQGVAAHWAYKEAGAQGYKGVVAASRFDAKVALARQLMAWRGELAGAGGDAEAQVQGASANPFDDRVYVLTPQARIIELEAGSTAVDFAYAVHTDLGHRCRGARVDGALLPLNTPLRSGQTVEIVAAKQGGPSRDWLNPELGFLRSARARAKARAWFNAQQLEQTIAGGRAQIDKLLQREGRTGMSLQELATGLGLRGPEQLFERVGSESLPLRQVENFLRGEQAETAAPEELALRAAKAQPGGVLVVGVDALLTQLAGCCKPAPPDAICGFVTRGRGVSVHRADCSNARHLQQRHPERVIPVTWGARNDGVFAVDLMVEAQDRHGLLRDISEVFSKGKLKVIGVRTQSRGDTAHMMFTVELPGLEALPQALNQLREVQGVRRASRR
ncbi:MAG: bifunctional (p)ppGpp synthetase/guanosine-3',5'-bis(diphosphate) 3'-pyrophosphohydrolase [Betaproteobacteria bacterium]|nr:bifunctional (p)ppGpp synthetase/guanosine-3',5'-bis(diphosphate) 3'-pyrophosphohydrolase [Betaproteobacteria bacterium]